MIGPSSCFEEDLGGHSPSPGPRLAGPGERRRWFGQRWQQGAGERGTQGVRNQAEPEPTGHRGSCFRDEGQGVQEGALVWASGRAMVCVSDGKHRDSAGLGQRSGPTGWRGTARRREGSGQGGAALHTFSRWQHCPPAAWLPPGRYSGPRAHTHPPEAFPQAADPPRNALCQDLLPFSLGTEQHLPVSSLSKYVSPFPESNIGFRRA